MRRILAALMVVMVLVAPTVASAKAPFDKGWVWDQNRVTVADYTSPAYQAEIIDTIEDINEIAPPGAPRLTYKRMPQKTCIELLKNPRGIFGTNDMDAVTLRGITVCEDDLPETVTGMVLGVTWFEGKGKVFEKVMVGFDPAASLFPDVVCHEFMHAYTGIPDNYDSEPGRSCVYGSLVDPGPFDVKYIRKVYRDYERGKD